MVWDSSNSDGNTALLSESISESLPPKTSPTSEKIATKTRRNQYLESKRMLLEQGFIPFKSVPRLARQTIMDPLYLQPAARPFHITGINAGHKGATKYSCFDFFGVRMLHESYYVTDWRRFSDFISTRLELIFRATNPDPARHLKTAFTRFMHNFGLHWTGCHDFKSQSFGCASSNVT